MTTAPSVALPPTAISTARSLAPDLARGAMLLLIALANAPWYLWASDTRALSTHPVDPSPLDAVVQSISLIAIDGRTYPMFAFLFGYGIWQLYSRQIAGGVSRREARRVLRRRHWWMLAFGLVHAALLWMGDIVGAYGLAGLVLTWLFLDRKDVTIKVWAIVLTSLLGLGAIFAAIGGIFASQLGTMDAETAFVLGDSRSSMEQGNYLLSILPRLEVWALITPAQGLVGLAVPVAILLAFLAARHRVLENPLGHLRLLRITAIVGLVVGWGTGLFVAAQNLDLLGMPRDFDWAFSGAQGVSGLMCGVGYVAVFGLIAARIQRRSSPGRVAYALQAVGKRSLSSYLAQSVIMAPVLSAWGFGLGAALTSSTLALFAIATWAVTVVLAVVLERRGKRGPAEWLLRKLAYPARPLKAKSTRVA